MCIQLYIERAPFKLSMNLDHQNSTEPTLKGTYIHQCYKETIIIPNWTLYLRGSVAVSVLEIGSLSLFEGPLLL